MEVSFLNVLQLFVVGIILFLLFKYRIARVVTKVNYVSNRLSNRLTVTYKKFDGFHYYFFYLRKKETATLQYEVTVEEGSLTLEWRGKRDALFRETFTENKRGTFTFTAKDRIYSLKLDADQSRGGCDIRLIRK